MTANDNRTRNPKMREATGSESAELAAFAAGLRFEDIPNRWSTALSTSSSTGPARHFPAAVSARSFLEKFASGMGPADGRSEILDVAHA